MPTYTPTFKGSRPFEVWSLDLVTNLPEVSPDGTSISYELPTTLKGHKHLLVIICMFSKWVEAFPLTSKTSDEVLDKFFSEIICRYGLPK